MSNWYSTFSLALRCSGDVVHIAFMIDLLRGPSYPSWAPMSHRSTPTTPSAEDPNKFSFADMLELRDWAAAAVAQGWACEAQADPRRGQLWQVGNLPGGREFVTISVTGARSRRHVRIERCDGLWIVRPVWARRASVFLTLRRALEHLCGTIACGLRPPLPRVPPEGYDPRNAVPVEGAETETHVHQYGRRSVKD